MFFDQQQRDAAQRQQLLLARSSRLRQQLSDDVQVLQRPLALADQVRHGWRWLRAHPEVPAAGILVLAWIRPRRAWRLASRLWAGWQLWRRVRRLQQGWLAHQPTPHQPPR